MLSINRVLLYAHDEHHQLDEHGTMLRSGLFRALDIRREKCSLQSEIVCIVILLGFHSGKMKKKLTG